MTKGFNRLTIRAALVLTMALGGGLLGAGCGTNDGPENEAGSGGEAGSAGEGGTGGTAGTGGTGGTGGGGAEPVEFTDCEGDEGTAVNLADGGMLVCTDEVFTDLSIWLRACEVTTECADPTSFCAFAGTQGGTPFCLPNFCGNDRSIYPNANNGDFFGRCNSVDGTVQVFDKNGSVIDETPDSELTGTCLPLSTLSDGTAFGYCVASGSIPVGGSCDDDGRIGKPETLCAQGSLCTRAGTCVETCDAGEFPSTAEFAGCATSTEVCHVAISKPATDFVLGLCGEEETTEEPGTGDPGADD